MSSDDQEHARQLIDRDTIMPWVEVAQGARLNADVLPRLMPPSVGSLLRPVPDNPFSNMAWWCYSLLEAAADHLVLWADYVAPLKVHPQAETVHTLRPIFTLARATIESAAQAIWVLSPEDQLDRVRRYVRLAVWDLDEQTKAAATNEARAELEARRSQILTALGVTRRTFQAPRYLDMILAAADFLDGDDASSPWTSDRVRRIWRSTAGAAHGKRWTDFEFHDREPAGDELVYATPKADAISEVLKLADRYLSAGVIIFAMRAGHWEQFRQLWDDATERLMLRMST
ncbi:MAG: hypothetical protein QM572_15730 [Nocardioides sp.]|uniref:hypothetical protein n=1 Tax=Nocardioides sp. TaxID=35761 RepID=UPI0039E66F6E